MESRLAIVVIAGVLALTWSASADDSTTSGARRRSSINSDSPMVQIGELKILSRTFEEIRSVIALPAERGRVRLEVRVQTSYGDAAEAYCDDESARQALLDHHPLPEFVGVWADWGKDGVFQQTGESLGIQMQSVEFVGQELVFMFKGDVPAFFEDTSVEMLVVLTNGDVAAQAGVFAYGDARQVSVPVAAQVSSPTDVLEAFVMEVDALLASPDLTPQAQQALEEIRHLAQKTLEQVTGMARRRGEASSATNLFKLYDKRLKEILCQLQSDALLTVDTTVLVNSASEQMAMLARIPKIREVRLSLQSGPGKTVQVPVEFEGVVQVQLIGEAGQQIDLSAFPEFARVVLKAVTVLRGEATATLVDPLGLTVFFRCGREGNVNLKVDLGIADVQEIALLIGSGNIGNLASFNLSAEFRMVQRGEVVMMPRIFSVKRDEQEQNKECSIIREGAEFCSVEKGEEKECSVQKGAPGVPRCSVIEFDRVKCSVKGIKGECSLFDGEKGGNGTCSLFDTNNSRCSITDSSDGKCSILGDRPPSGSQFCSVRAQHEGKGKDNQCSITITDNREMECSVLLKDKEGRQDTTRFRCSVGDNILSKCSVDGAVPSQQGQKKQMCSVLGGSEGQCSIFISSTSQCSVKMSDNFGECSVATSDNRQQECSVHTPGGGNGEPPAKGACSVEGHRSQGPEAQYCSLLGQNGSDKDPEENRCSVLGRMDDGKGAVKVFCSVKMEDKRGRCSVRGATEKKKGVDRQKCSVGGPTLERQGVKDRFKCSVRAGPDGEDFKRFCSVGSDIGNKNSGRSGSCSVFADDGKGVVSCSVVVLDGPPDRGTAECSIFGADPGHLQFCSVRDPDDSGNRRCSLFAIKPADQTCSMYGKDDKFGGACSVFFSNKGECSIILGAPDPPFCSVLKGEFGKSVTVCSVVTSAKPGDKSEARCSIIITEGDGDDAFCSLKKVGNEATPGACSVSRLAPDGKCSVFVEGNGRRGNAKCSVQGEKEHEDNEKNRLCTKQPK